MHIPVFLAVTLILVVLVNLASSKNKRDRESSLNAFWDREMKANTTRKKDISNIDFITIPDFLSSPTGSVSEEIQDIEARISELKEKKMVNFSGKTNTDLKLEYGAANFPLLSEWDSNYIKLVQLMQKYILALRKEGYDEKASQIVTFAREIAPEVNIFKQD
ncbi:MAG: hypothetical protein K6G60_09340 [Lachnospiraceae bacterium]|nr:hypothetical protein [Lachnospiraceae bacterium]